MRYRGGKSIVAIACLCLSQMAFVCGPPNPDVIVNELDTPVLVAVEFEESDGFSGEIGPGEEAAVPSMRLGISKIEIQTNGDVLYTYDGTESDRLASGFTPGQRLLWRITRDGLLTAVLTEKSEKLE